MWNYNFKSQSNTFGYFFLATTKSTKSFSHVSLRSDYGWLWADGYVTMWALCGIGCWRSAVWVLRECYGWVLYVGDKGGIWIGRLNTHTSVKKFFFEYTAMCRIRSLFLGVFCSSKYAPRWKYCKWDRRRYFSRFNEDGAKFLMDFFASVIIIPIRLL